MRKRIYSFLGLLLVSPNAFAHGVIGARFLPATLTIDDPFVADEMSLLTVGMLKAPVRDTTPATRETDYGMDISKRISRNWGIGAAAIYKDFKGEEGGSSEGFDNIDTNVQYQFFKSPDHEAVSSLKLDWEMGGTGNAQIADKFSRFMPSLLFGKGLGDLPDTWKYLKPLALTGVFGTSFPTHNSDQDTGNAIPKNAVWGFTVQYNLPYLQSNVKDIGLPQPLSRMIPLVEFPMQTPWNGVSKGRTTGTANPGVIWFGRYFQLALEAQVPINAASGKSMGAIGQIHLYLDDIAPKIFTWTPFSGVLGPTQPK